ncbi:MAG: VanZ family protein [Firmicutes bacterium]|nr:VanZ family protein [Bacillota bacterium]
MAAGRSAGRLYMVWQVFIQAHALEWGKTGFFSYVISFHPDFLLHKLGHIVVFGLLGVALYYACDEQRRRAVFWAMVFAAGDEWHQAYVPGRSCRLGDIVLDTLAAALCIWAWRQLAKKRIAGS